MEMFLYLNDCFTVLLETMVSVLYYHYCMHVQVLETANQMADSPTSSTPVPYDPIKNLSEALVMGTNQKISVLQSLEHKKIIRAASLLECDKLMLHPLQLPHAFPRNFTDSSVFHSNVTFP